MKLTGESIKTYAFPVSTDEQGQLRIKGPVLKPHREETREMTAIHAELREASLRPRVVTGALGRRAHP